MTHRSTAPAYLAAAALLAGCTAITQFDTSNIAEDSDELCTDGVDNDANGLADCHDFSCLPQAACCTIPRVELIDDFAGPVCAAQSCDSPDPCRPDPALWTSWGAPQPVLCEDRLVPNKIEQCYDVGALSALDVKLEPGLVADATLIGVPELRGRLEIGFTLQQSIPGSGDPCAVVSTAQPVISIRQLADDSGHRLVARFDQEQIGLSEALSGPGPRTVRLSIGDDRRAHYFIDNVEFAASPENQPLPDPGPSARLVIAGRGRSAGVSDVSVTVGTQCDSPNVWSPADQPVALDTSEASWDSHAVFAPVVTESDGSFELYYTGCSEQVGICDPLVAGLGIATLDDELVAQRVDDCPIVGVSTAVCSGGLINPFTDQFNNLIAAAPYSLGDDSLLMLSQLEAGAALTTARTGDELMVVNQAISSGAAGEWDSHEICCASVTVDAGAVRMWYSGRDRANGPWRIGLAESADGTQFAKHPRNPVLEEGDTGSFDEAGVRKPAVLFSRGLFRMYYEAVGFFGAPTIGYAVSVDGVRWHKFPANPVVTPEILGLVSVDGPAIVEKNGELVMFLSGRDPNLPGSRIYRLDNRPAESE